jgi:NitT/TauT family transport system substrate-binding protein
MRQFLLICTTIWALTPLAWAQKIESPDIKITLDWAFQGPQSAFLYGAEKGEFSRRGINAQIDRGTGSSDVMVRVASGAYQFGWADIATMVKFNAENPDKALIAAYVTGGNSPLAVITVAGRGIATPKDLAGRTLGAAAGSAALALFDAFGASAGFDPSSVHWKLLGGALREPMMVRGEVDAVAGFTTSSIMSVVSLGVPLDKVVVLRYNDYGIHQYGTAFVMRPDFARANPNTTRAVIAALNASQKDAIADPAASVAAIRARDPLVNLGTECTRLVEGLQTLTLTPEFKTKGISSIDPQRMQASIDELLKAFHIDRKITVDQVYTAAWLPPAAERMPPPLGGCGPNG